MIRRDLLSLLGGAAAWPAVARAQQSAMKTVGFLSSGAAGPFAERLRAFRQGLSEMGYAEGQNLTIEYRWAEGRYDRLPALAADLVRLKVAVIFASNGIDAPAAKAATTTIPIVFNAANDPVQSGMVSSLNRPSGNVTGVITLNLEVGQKRLLHEMVPMATDIALLVNPTNNNVERTTSDLRAAAGNLGLQLHVLQASTERDFDAAFAAVDKFGAAGLLISTDPFFTSRSAQLAGLALRHAVPAVYQTREFAAAGGLIGYGGNIADAFRSAGIYVGRVLKGEKPGDLPVQLSTKVELTLNLNTAKALGLTVPIALLTRADEVIE